MKYVVDVQGLLVVKIVQVDILMMLILGTSILSGKTLDKCLDQADTRIK
jgi:hypothetical protein